jgi:hypothetical protein
MTVYAMTEILNRLPSQPLKVNFNEYKCCCWHHCDATPSLYISDREDRVLIHCFGCGASAETLLSGLGLPIPALFDSYWINDDQKKKWTGDEFRQASIEATLKYIDSGMGSTPSALKYRKIKKFEDRIDLLAGLKKKVDTYVSTLDKDQNLRLYSNFQILYNLLS